MLWRCLLLLRVPGAWLGAALWALHPVEAESVAWIAEMKNTQSGLFYLLSIFFFIRSLPAAGVAVAWRGNYALAIVFGVLAMASKSSTVVLPVVLGVIAWWAEGGSRGRTVAKLAPFVLLSLIASLMALWAVDLQGVNQDTAWLRSWPERFITAGNVFWFYLGKLAWPHPLVFIYPRWELQAAQPLAYVPLVAAAALFLALILIRSVWAKAGLFAMTYFVAALLPVLGLVETLFSALLLRGRSSPVTLRAWGRSRWPARRLRGLRASCRASPSCPRSLAGDYWLVRGVDLAADARVRKPRNVVE